MPRVMQVVKCMEESLLGLLFTAHKLNVVNQQYLDAAVAIAEFLGGAVADGRYELVGKLLRRDIQCRQTLADTGLANGVEQVSLTQSNARVEEQGVIGMTGSVNNGPRRAVGHPVGWADHVGLECILGVEGKLRSRIAVGRSCVRYCSACSIGQGWISAFSFLQS